MRNSKGQFIKGMTPHNKGILGYSNKGSFKKGHKPLNNALEIWRANGGINSNKGTKKIFNIICQKCSKEFQTLRANQKFCSHICSPKLCKKGEIIKCQVCNNSFYIQCKRIGKAKYCSRSCRFISQKGKKSNKYIEDRTQLKRFNDIVKDRRSSAYGSWRHQVKIRDNFRCKIENLDCKGRLEVHHILGYTEHPKLRYEVNNGITLCQFHHPRIRSEEKRLSPYFQEIVLK